LARRQEVGVIYDCLSRISWDTKKTEKQRLMPTVQKL